MEARWEYRTRCSWGNCSSPCWSIPRYDTLGKKLALKIFDQGHLHPKPEVLGIEPGPTRWEASTLEKSHSNSLLTDNWNIYICARDQWRMLATDPLARNFALLRNPGCYSLFFLRNAQFSTSKVLANKKTKRPPTIGVIHLRFLAFASTRSFAIWT